ncbi:N-acyl homoserine lactonase family protein [Pseudorhodoferax sp.]|uniref:N-acyl homoserine lactonase family protein n=1 Tax=Pseudorhodoferax sp. TaxID=1993553 RepID=UPI002DD63E4D|nr:N-acyl homoserine lactonase family protein [Pseudorhodoferax sp.]
MPDYEVLAIRYAERDALRSANFVGGDPHDAPMPMAYYLWLLRGPDRTVVVDTGFGEDMAAKRHRRLLHHPVAALAAVGVDAGRVRDVVVTHLHNDHIGCWDGFGTARFHLQDAEMRFATGRCMGCEPLRRAYEPDHVTSLVRLVYQGRVVFHDGDAEIAPGISVHRLGGHTAGLQVVRVQTARGPVVLASDASHYYEHMQTERVFPVVFHLGDVVQGYRRMQELAASPAHLVPGHDPLVMQRYPAEPGCAGLAVRLDLAPLR